MTTGFSLYTPTYIQPTMTPAPPRPPYKEKFNFNISCQVPKNFKDVNHKVSIAWKFFQIDEDEQIGRCNFCGMLYAVKNWTTSSLLRHLRRSHKHELEQATIKQVYLKNLSRAEHAKLKQKYKGNFGEEEEQEDDSQVIEEKPEWKNLRPPVKQNRLLVDDFYEKKKSLNQIFSNNPILAHYINCFPLDCSPHEILMTLRKTNQFDLMEIRQGYDRCYWAKAQNTIPQLFVRLDKNQHIHQMIPNLVNHQQQISSITIISRKMNENYLKYGCNKPTSFLYSSKIIKNCPMKINVTNATYYSSSQYHPLPKNFYSNGGTDITTYKELEGVMYIVGHKQDKNQPIIFGIVLVFDCFYVSPFLKQSKRQEKIVIEDDFEGCTAIFKNYFQSLLAYNSESKNEQKCIKQNNGLPSSIFIDAPHIFYQGFHTATQQIQLQYKNRKQRKRKLKQKHINLDDSEQWEQQEMRQQQNNQYKINKGKQVEQNQIIKDPDNLTKVIVEGCTVKYLMISQILLDSIYDKQSLQKKLLHTIQNRIRKKIQIYKKKYITKKNKQITTNILGLFSMINIPYFQALMAMAHGIQPIYINQQYPATILANYLRNIFKMESISPNQNKKSSYNANTNIINRISRQLKRLLNYVVGVMAEQVRNPGSAKPDTKSTFLLIQSMKYLWLQGTQQIIDAQGEEQQSIIQNILKRFIEKVPWYIYQKIMIIWAYTKQRLKIEAPFLGINKPYLKIFNVYQHSQPTDYSIIYKKLQLVSPEHKKHESEQQSMQQNIMGPTYYNERQFKIQNNYNMLINQQINEIDGYESINSQILQQYDKNEFKVDYHKQQVMLKNEGSSNTRKQLKQYSKQQQTNRDPIKQKLLKTLPKKIQKLRNNRKQIRKRTHHQRSKQSQIKYQQSVMKTQQHINHEKNFFDHIQQLTMINQSNNNQKQMFEVVYLPQNLTHQLQNQAKQVLVCSCGLTEFYGLPCPHILACIRYIEQNISQFSEVLTKKTLQQSLQKIIINLISDKFMKNSDNIFIKLEQEQPDSMVVGIIEAQISDFMQTFQNQNISYYKVYKSDDLNMKTIGYDGLLKLLFSV